MKVQKGKRTQGPLSATGADKKLRGIGTNPTMSQSQKNAAARSVGKRAGPNASKMKGYTKK